MPNKTYTVPLPLGEIGYIKVGSNIQHVTIYDESLEENLEVKSLGTYTNDDGLVFYYIEYSDGLDSQWVEESLIVSDEWESDFNFDDSSNEYQYDLDLVESWA